MEFNVKYKGLCNITGVSGLPDQLMSALVKFHGAKPVTLTFERNIIGNIKIDVDHVGDRLPYDVTILAPIPSVTKSPSDCVIELMLAIQTLRVRGTTSFHIIFIYAPFDGSGSRISPTTPGFHILCDFINSCQDIRKVTVLGPHSSQLEGMFHLPRNFISHIDILQLHQRLSGVVDPRTTAIVSPDVGGYYTAAQLGQMQPRLSTQPILSLTPGIPLPDTLEYETVVLIDDMIITGSKILMAYEQLCQYGFGQLIIGITHCLHQNGIDVLQHLLENDDRVILFISDTRLTLTHPRCTIHSVESHIVKSFLGVM